MGACFIDPLEIIIRLVNIGDAKSFGLLPRIHDHRQLKAQKLAAARVPEDLERISVGIKHVSDVVADIEQTLAKV